jgi:membrane fusion protein (multidrug efflux system)
MLKRVFLALLLLALFLGTVFGLKYRQQQQAAGQHMAPPPAVVAVTTVREDDWRPQLNAVGSLVAAQGIEVSNEVAGVVSTIHFESGQAVRKGDALLDLDTTADRAELKGLQALRRLAQLKFQRAAKLLPERSMSQADYDEAKATLDGAEAAVDARQALIDKKRISAPFDGALGIRQVDPGQYLAEGSAIVSLQSLDPIYCDFTLPERHLGTLAAGQAVTVAVQAYPDETFEGRVSAFDPGVDVGTRSLRIRATLDNPGQRLRPGMFAEVRVLLPARAAVPTLPDTAISFNPYGDSVFVIEDGESGLTVQRRQVETGEVRDGRVQIRSGLQAGQRVVSAGQVKLRNGMAVSLDDKPAPGERKQ